MEDKNAFENQPDWRQFEILVGMLLADHFGIAYQNPEALVTRAHSDGGYDGLFEISVFESKEPFRTIIFECKLRTDFKKDLALQEFSKAMIVAVNIAAQYLIIGTNLHFSKGTIQKLDRFSQKTQLHWSLLGAQPIMRWVDSQQSNGNLKHISPSLYELLRESQPYSNEVGEEPLQKDIPYKDEPFISEKRARMCQDVSGFFKEYQKGILIVSGESGIGKSFFCEKLISNIQTSSHMFACYFDLAKCATPRVFFEQILSELWSVQVETLFAMETKDFSDVTRKIGDEILDEQTHRALINTFSQNAESYNQKADIYNELLTTYLVRIFELNKTRWRLIFYFYNINHATEQILALLLEVLRKFYDRLPIILELRTSLYTDGLMPEERWLQYLKAFRRLPTPYSEIEIHRPCIEEVFAFIDSKCAPYFITPKAKKEIYQYFGYKPLYLSFFISWIRIRNWQDLYPTELQEMRIRNLMIDTEQQSIALLLDTLCLCNIKYAEIFFLSVLFQNSVPVEAAEFVLGTHDFEKIKQVLEEEQIYVQIEKDFSVRHTIVYHHIQKLKQPAITRRKEIANGLLNVYKTWVHSPDRQAKIEIQLLYTLEFWSKLIDLSANYSINMYKSGQFFLCVHYAEISLEACRKHDFSLGDNSSKAENAEKTLRALLILLQSSGFVENTTTDNLYYWEQEARDIFEKYKKFFHTMSLYCELHSQYAMILNRYYLQHGENDKAYSILKTALKEAKHEKHLYPGDTLPHMAWEFAIITKTIYNNKKALSILRYWKRKYPNVLGLQIHYNVQSAEMYFPRNLKRAKLYTKRNYKLRDLVDDASSNARYRLAMWNIHLFEGNYDYVLQETHNALPEFESKGLRSELGRLLHLNACALWMLGQTQKAAETFVQAENVYVNNSYYSNEWPLLLDGILFACEQNCWNYASQFAIKLQGMFLKMYGLNATRHNWVGVCFESEEFPKSFAGFLLYINALYQFAALEKEPETMLIKLKEEVKHPILSEYFAQKNPPDWLQSKMADITYRHKNHWLIGC